MLTLFLLAIMSLTFLYATFHSESKIRPTLCPDGNTTSTNFSTPVSDILYNRKENRHYSTSEKNVQNFEKMHAAYWTCKST